MSDYLADDGNLPRPERGHGKNRQSPTFTKLESLAKRAAFQAESYGKDDTEKFLLNLDKTASDTSAHVAEAVQAMTQLVRSTPVARLRSIIPQLQEIETLYHKEAIFTTPEDKKYIAETTTKLVAFIQEKTTLFARVKSTLGSVAKAKEEGFVTRAAGSESVLLRAGARAIQRRMKPDEVEQERLKVRSSVAQRIVSQNQAELGAGESLGGEEPTPGKKGGKSGGGGGSDVQVEILEVDRQILAELKKENENWEQDKEGQKRAADEKKETKAGAPARVRKAKEEAKQPTMLDKVIGKAETIFGDVAKSMGGILEKTGAGLFEAVGGLRGIGGVIAAEITQRLASAGIDKLNAGGTKEDPKNIGRTGANAKGQFDLGLGDPFKDKGVEAGFDIAGNMAGRGNYLGAAGVAAATSAYAAGRMVQKNRSAMWSMMKSPMSAVTALQDMVGSAAAPAFGATGFDYYDTKTAEAEQDGRKRNVAPPAPKPLLNGQHPEAHIGAAPTKPVKMPAVAHMSAAQPGTALPAKPERVSDKIVSVESDGAGFLIAKMSDGTSQKRTGPMNWRNNNPGNLRYTDWSKAHGAIANASGYAVFPDVETGRKARELLLFEGKTRQHYDQLSVSKMIEVYAPPSENPTAEYQKFVLSALHGHDVKLADMTTDERKQLMSSMEKFEGFKSGNIAPTRAALTKDATGATQTNIVVTPIVQTNVGGGSGGGSGMVIPAAPMTTGHPDDTLRAMKRSAPLD